MLNSNFPEYVLEIEERLRKIAAVVRRRGRMLLEQFDITAPQFDALVVLYWDGELTIGDLSNRLHLAYSTTTDLVDRLERAELVLRQRDESDRRVVRVQIQKSGSSIIERVLDARRAYLSPIIESIPEVEREQILHVLDLLNLKMSEQ